MMLVKKYPSIINMTIKIDKASLGAASDVQGLHKGRLGIGEKTVEGLVKFRHKQSPEQGRLWKWMRATRTSSKV